MDLNPVSFLSVSWDRQISGDPQFIGSIQQLSCWRHKRPLQWNMHVHDKWGEGGGGKKGHRPPTISYPHAKPPTATKPRLHPLSLQRKHTQKTGKYGQEQTSPNINWHTHTQTSNTLRMCSIPLAPKREWEGKRERQREREQTEERKHWLWRCWRSDRWTNHSPHSLPSVNHSSSRTGGLHRAPSLWVNNRWSAFASDL